MKTEDDLSTRYNYPEAPGAQKTDTSFGAARSMDVSASTLRGRCLAALSGGNLTADQIAGVVGESILAIRPRVTELRLLGSVRDTGQRRPNASGRSAIVWTIMNNSAP